MANSKIKVKVKWKAYILTFKTLKDAENFCEKHKEDNPTIIKETNKEECA